MNEQQEYFAIFWRRKTDNKQQEYYLLNQQHNVHDTKSETAYIVDGSVGYLRKTDSKPSGLQRFWAKLSGVPYKKKERIDTSFIEGEKQGKNPDDFDPEKHGQVPLYTKLEYALDALDKLDVCLNKYGVNMNLYVGKISDDEPNIVKCSLEQKEAIVISEKQMIQQLG